jgi:hypothetical protein
VQFIAIHFISNIMSPSSQSISKTLPSLQGSENCYTSFNATGKLLTEKIKQTKT